MNFSLCLTLGHNSSAILVEDGQILCGYENERLSGIKSDSQFPVHAIVEIGKHFDLDFVDSIYVSHWATYGKVEEMSFKHWRPDLLEALCPNANIQDDVDHHTCHVEALRVFTDFPFEWEIIADGFGNFNETVSIYHNKELVLRSFGFDKSIGLLYQYATAYLDMKMNQDEYKLLGYESHISEVVSPLIIDNIDTQSMKLAKRYVKLILSSDINPDYDFVLGLEALPNIRLAIHNKLDNILYNKIGIKREHVTDYSKKVIIAYFIQSVVEQVFSMIIDHFAIRQVALSGGVFMNVKLNNVIAKKVNRISIMPICGDQSGALGAYQYHRKDLVWPDHLFWSIRDLSIIPLNISQLCVFEKYEITSVLQLIRRELKNNGIVNLVFGNGEFGARALGHTTTLALPTIENVEYINHLNERTTIMPMAGMVDYFSLNNYDGTEKVLKSLEYMIMTLDYKGEPSYKIKGCHHKHPLKDIWTNRVQILPKGELFYNLLLDFKYLINTSFNVHGQPIVLTHDQIIKAHMFQIERDNEKRVTTIVIK